VVVVGTICFQCFSAAKEEAVAEAVAGAVVLKKEKPCNIKFQSVWKTCTKAN